MNTQNSMNIGREIRQVKTRTSMKYIERILFQDALINDVSVSLQKSHFYSNVKLI